MTQVLPPSHRQSASQPTQQAGNWHNNHCQDANLVDLPPFDQYLSDQILASVFSNFQLSPAYQTLVVEEKWLTADHAIFATPSLL